ncbi:MAG: patatin family protein [Proteobacteria bacterium]|nr:patatin family protein [Pseudomonadota bacterium]
MKVETRLGPESAGLILEGGGMRGIYTAGVLRCFMDHGLWFPYVIGVSMGACNGANYLARQPERNRIVNTRFVNDPRFLSYRRLLTGGGLFGMDFIFHDIPFQLVPFDLDAFLAADEKFWLAAADCESGEAVYYEKNEMGLEFLTVLRAGCSLPLVQKYVEFGGRKLLDGGLADSVPLGKSLADGNRKNVLVLTQPRGYRKKRSSAVRLVRWRYRRFPRLADAFARRHIQYNETMDRIDLLEASGEVFVVRPSEPLPAGRTERNKDRLYLAYDQGYTDMKTRFAALLEYLGLPNESGRMDPGRPKRERGPLETDR